MVYILYAELHFYFTQVTHQHSQLQQRYNGYFRLHFFLLTISVFRFFEKIFLAETCSSVLSKCDFPTYTQPLQPFLWIVLGNRHMNVSRRCTVPVSYNFLLTNICTTNWWNIGDDLMREVMSHYEIENLLSNVNLFS